MSGANGDQKRVFDPLVLELWLAVSHYVYAGTEPWSSARAARALKLLSHLSCPQEIIFKFSVYSALLSAKVVFCCLIGCFVFLICIMCIGVYCWHVCLCTRCMPNSGRDQKKPLDTVELVKQMVASCCMGARN